MLQGIVCSQGCLRTAACAAAQQCHSQACCAWRATLCLLAARPQQPGLRSPSGVPECRRAGKATLFWDRRRQLGCCSHSRRHAHAATASAAQKILPLSQSQPGRHRQGCTAWFSSGRWQRQCSADAAGEAVSSSSVRVQLTECRADCRLTLALVPAMNVNVLAHHSMSTSEIPALKDYGYACSNAATRCCISNNGVETPAWVQVVVADSGSVRLPSSIQLTSPAAGIFGADMPREIPVPRWDPDDFASMRLNGKTAARFAALMTGARLPCASVCWILNVSGDWLVQLGHAPTAIVCLQLPLCSAMPGCTMNMAGCFSAPQAR